jgi:hypothetical protein
MGHLSFALKVSSWQRTRPDRLRPRTPSHIPPQILYALNRPSLLIRLKNGIYGFIIINEQLTAGLC